MKDIEVLKRWIRSEFENLCGQAKELNDYFWSERDRVIENKVDGAFKPILGSRVRIKDGSLSMSWFYEKYYMDRASGKPKRNNIHIKMNRTSGKYHLNTIQKYAPESLSETIQTVEMGYTEIRKKIKIIHSVKKLIEAYENI